MALKFVVDSLDSIEETVRPLYKQDGDKFRLDLDGYEPPDGLKSALEKERKAAKEAAKQASQWASLGKTPEEIQALLEAQQRAEEEKATKGGEFEKLKQQMLEKHNSDLAKKDERITTLTKSLERRLVDADATAAIAAQKGVPALLLPHVRAAVKVVEEDGEFKALVVDSQGNPRVNGKGEFLSIADLVSEMRQSDIYGRAFEASGASGGGSTPSNPGSKPSKKASEMSPAEKAEFIGANGIQKWQDKLSAEYAK